MVLFDVVYSVVLAFQHVWLGVGVVFSAVVWVYIDRFIQVVLRCILEGYSRLQTPICNSIVSF